MASSSKTKQDVPVKRATPAHIIYANEQIGRMKELDPLRKVDKQLRQQLKADYDALNANEKSRYVSMFEDGSRAYRLVNPPTKRTKFPMQTRMQLATIVDIVGNLSDGQIGAVKDIGFGGIVSLRCKHLDTGLCKFLIARYKAEGCQLDVHGHQLPITTRDVEEIIGLKNAGEPVTLGNSTRESFTIDGTTNGRVALKVLSDRLKAMDSHGREFKIIFALYILGAFLCPTTENSISLKYLDAVQPEQIASLNWAEFVFNFLVKGMKKMKENNNQNPSGCLFILIVKFLDNMAAIPPNDNIHPRIGFWSNEEINKRIAFLKQSGGYDSAPVEMVDRIRAQRRQGSADMTSDLKSAFVQDLTSHVRDVLLPTITVELKAILLKEFRDLKSVLVPEIVGEVKKLLSRNDHSKDSTESPANFEDSPIMRKVTEDTNAAQHVDFNVFNPKFEFQGDPGAENEEPNPFQSHDDTCVPIGRVEVNMEVGGHEKDAGQKTYEGEEQHIMTADNAPDETCILVKRNKERDAASSNIAQRVKSKPPRMAPSRYLTTPYTDQGRKRKGKNPQVQEAARVIIKMPMAKKSRQEEKVEMAVGRQSAKGIVILSDTTVVPTPPHPLHTRLHHDTDYNESDAIMQYVFRDGGDSEQLVDCVGAMWDLTRGVMVNSLGPQRWVLGPIIEMLAFMLTLDERERCPVGLSTQPISWYLSPKFQENLIGLRPLPNDKLTNVHAFSMWAFERCEKIYIPMNDTRSHWYLVVVSVKSNEIEILDTMRGRKSRYREKEVAKLRDAMAGYFGKTFAGSSYAQRLREATVSQATWVPEQPNDFDCGVFVLKMMMQQLTKENSALLQWDSERERRDLIMYFINSNHNELKEYIQRMVKPFTPYVMRDVPDDSDSNL